MLEKPHVSDASIISHLQNEYKLETARLTFLPLGADPGTAVYCVESEAGNAYFLKLRTGFEARAVSVPLFLKSLGIQEIIAPLESNSAKGWADFGEYTMILYPFIEGKDGFERPLTDDQKRRLGSALYRIHTANVPADIEKQLPRETFSPGWRERLKTFQGQVKQQTFIDPTALKLAEFMQARQEEIAQLVGRAEQLALEIQSRALPSVLCHSDLHGGNILLSNDGRLYIVDWDAPLLAPKERDLMFIGGGIDEIWKGREEEALFYEGYGKPVMDIAVLAYYRYERIIEDLAVICEQLLLSDEGGADRERSLGWFTSNFEPGGTLSIAYQTDSLLL